jgi:hypothetical protein
MTQITATVDFGAPGNRSGGLRVPHFSYAKCLPGLRGAIGAGHAGILRYHAFDLLALDGYDLRDVEYAERKRLLGELLDGAPPTLMLVEYLEADGARAFAHACRMGLEGLVAKRLDAPYGSGRVETWIKLKCVKSDTFPIVVFAAFTTSVIAAFNPACASETTSFNPRSPRRGHSVLTLDVQRQAVAAHVAAAGDWLMAEFQKIGSSSVPYLCAKGPSLNNRIGRKESRVREERNERIWKLACPEGASV